MTRTRTTYFVNSNTGSIEATTHPVRAWSWQDTDETRKGYSVEFVNSYGKQEKCWHTETLRATGNQQWWIICRSRTAAIRTANEACERIIADYQARIAKYQQYIATQHGI
jgi:hypothetical protein